jgi:hypothetical protein
MNVVLSNWTEICCYAGKRSGRSSDPVSNLGRALARLISTIVVSNLCSRPHNHGLLLTPTQMIRNACRSRMNHLMSSPSHNP